MKKKANYFLKLMSISQFLRGKKSKDVPFFWSDENLQAKKQIENRQFSLVSGNLPPITFGISHYCQCHLSSC